MTMDPTMRLMRQQLRAAQREEVRVSQNIGRLKARKMILTRFEAEMDRDPDWRPNLHDIDELIGSFGGELDDNERLLLETAKKIRGPLVISRVSQEQAPTPAKVLHGTDFESLGQGMIASIRTEGVVRRFVILHPNLQFANHKSFQNEAVPVYRPVQSNEHQWAVAPTVVGRWVENLRLKTGPLNRPAIMLEQPYTFNDGTVSQPGRAMAIDPMCGVYRESDGRQVYSPRTNPAIAGTPRQWLKSHPEWPPKRLPPILSPSPPPEAEHVSIELGPYTSALEMQLRTLEGWRRLGGRSNAKLAITGISDHVWAKGMTSAFAATVADSLATARTFFVRDTIVALNEADIRSVPDDAALHMDELPSHEGFMYLEKPVTLRCVGPDRHVARREDMPALNEQTDAWDVEQPWHTQEAHQLRAISWLRVSATQKRGTVDVLMDASVSEPSLQIKPEDDKMFADLLAQLGPSLSDEQRRQLTDADYCLMAIYTDLGGGRGFLPIDLFMWVDGTSVGDNVPLTGGGHSDLLAPRKFFLALLSFMREKLSVTTERAPNSLMRKRLERESKAYQPIRVIHLREREPGHRENGHEANGTGRKFLYRFPVRSHIRNAWYPTMGPKDDPKAHRLIRIRAAIKGPKNAPFISKKVVVAVVR